MARAKAYLHAKFHLDPSNRLATVHERDRQDRQTDRKRSDSIGRTVLQTVAQKVISVRPNVLPLHPAGPGTKNRPDLFSRPDDVLRHLTRL